MKKIAIVCQYELLPTRIGGMDYFFWAFQKECNRLGIVIDWYFPNQANFGEYAGFNIIAGKNPELKIIENCKKNEYEIIMTHFVELCTSFFKELKKCSNAQIIAVDHNPRPLNGYPFKKKMIKKIKGILYSKYIDLFIGVSEYTKKEILNDFGKHILNKTKVIYNGVVTTDITKREFRNYTNPSFLVVSHLRESKGIQDLIKAVTALSVETKKDLKIDVYGDGPYKDYLLDLCGKLNVKDNFNFKGSSGDIKRVLADYDYLLHPTHMECFSLTILESLTANVPVITTPVGGNEEVISNTGNGLIFPVQNSQVLSEIIEKLYKGQIQIKEDTRELIEKQFSIEKMVQNYIDLL
ncbi:glycosyltransferase family 4 protein [Flavobacterium sp. H122]|uniref:glycosyltransferase family 4 protein n=1 Tax=Flavobacterium sp. H122 TaxID=2529860 RepID=UPI0010A9C84E|nr:glycosyltransferase family 4 protein [Flavobacterium sp. H122]